MFKPKQSDFPADTFLGRWIEYLSVQETPMIYDVWSGLWLLSIAAGRHILVDRPRAPVYLNLYVVLAAESGVTRKSTVVRMSNRIAKAFCARLPEAESYEIVENKCSPEKLELDLSYRSIEYGQGCGYIAIDEMVKFFGKERYTQTMPGVLTDLYDCPSDRRGGGSIARGVLPLRNIYLGIITASTPSWLMGAINPDIVEGGFTSRTIFAVDNRPKSKFSWPEQAVVEEGGLIDELVSLHEQCKHYRTITASDNARHHFDAWYRQRYIYRDPYRASFDSREDAHILKVAALLCINDRSFEITPGHVKYAIKLIGRAKEDGAALFESAGYRTRRIMGLDKLRDALIAAGTSTLKHSELLLRVRPHLNGAELQAAVDIMHELNLIQKFTVVSRSRGRPATIYRGTKLLKSRTAVSDVDAEFGD